MGHTVLKVHSEDSVLKMCARAWHVHVMISSTRKAHERNNPELHTALFLSTSARVKDKVSRTIICNRDECARTHLRNKRGAGPAMEKF